MAEVISALAWPIVVLVLALIVLAMARERGGDFLGAVIGRVRKLSLPGGVAVELAELSEARIGWSRAGLPEIEVLGGANTFIVTSGMTGILRLLREGEGILTSSYVVIDIEAGRRWITSRLFVLCALLEELARLRYIVFVESGSDTRRRFIGVAEPGKVRLRLAKRYPRLRRAFGEAYVDPPDQPQTISSFVKSMQEMDPAGTPDRDSRQFVQIKADVRTRIWEEAQWLDGALIEELLEDDLLRSRLRNIDLQGRSSDEKSKLFLSEEGAVVAVVDDRQRFEKLIDRRLLLEKVARLAVESERAK